MADYKLSYTAEEVDALLAKVKGGVCLPVVEFSSFSTDLTAEENAKLTACIGMPCIIKISGILSEVATYLYEEPNHAFILPTARGTFTSEDGQNWTLGGI